MSMIECDSLTKIYGKQTALQNVSFRIDKKGCIGFLGSNGAGKTTTIRILAGLSRPTSGVVKVIGYDAVTQQDHIRKELGYCPQSPQFYNFMTGEEWMHFTGSLFKVDEKMIKQKTELLLTDCGLWDARKRKIGGYSGGMKQRLAIAQALINNPKIVIMDEPVSALDPKGRYDVLMLIERLKKDLTIFMSTHILDDIERVADEVVIIEKGSIVLQSDMYDLKKKFMDPIIRFSVDGAIETFATTLSHKDSILQVEREQGSFKVTTNDVDEASSEIIQLISECKVKMVSFQLSEMTLEDIFFKVTEGK
ncbi:ABC transporter ATP-binding protein [Paenibacillus sp. JCM 10914]|uniref:ABC transporter ATP-binding protein n=1 Tax=Paenibacillus sp. JCM 10914 TaxID=1236974 RepID=UPI0003CC8700|nr:ABC transporter ATP-binding protein [Paenibacillus sp. JCM 10914]GAE10025.1 ABC transporter, ATP-binding protein [Paenibacillus sp. JCM 10914]